MKTTPHSIRLWYVHMNEWSRWPGEQQFFTTTGSRWISLFAVWPERSPPRLTPWSPVNLSAPLATGLTKEPLYIHTFQKVIPSYWALSIVELFLCIDGIHPCYHLDRTRLYVTDMGFGHHRLDLSCPIVTHIKPHPIHVSEYRPKCMCIQNSHSHYLFVLCIEWEIPTLYRSPPPPTHTTNYHTFSCSG